MEGLLILMYSPFMAGKSFLSLLLKNDKAVRIFKTYGWKWGGDWSGVKDYQHFSK